VSKDKPKSSDPSSSPSEKPASVDPAKLGAVLADLEKRVAALEEGAYRPK
jgi:hypothetical protein